MADITDFFGGNSKFLDENGRMLALMPKNGHLRICSDCGKWWGYRIRGELFSIPRCSTCLMSYQFILERIPQVEPTRYSGPKNCSICGENKGRGKNGFQSQWDRDAWCTWCAAKAIRSRRRRMLVDKKLENVRVKHRKIEKQWLVKARKSYKKVRKLVRTQRLEASNTQRLE